jgi:hypothetical protein
LAGRCGGKEASMLNAEIRDLPNTDGSHTVVGRVTGEYSELIRFYGAYETHRLGLVTKGTAPIIEGNAITIVAPSIDKECDAASTMRLCIEVFGVKTIQLSDLYGRVTVLDGNGTQPLRR